MPPPPKTFPRIPAWVRRAAWLLALCCACLRPLPAAASSPDASLAQRGGSELPGDVLALTASKPGGSHVIYMLWYAGDPHSRALFNGYLRHVGQLDAIGVRVLWIPLPTASRARLDTACLASIAGFVRCNADDYRAASGGAFDLLVRNFNAWSAFAEDHGLRGLWAAWHAPQGWTGSSTILAGHDGSVDSAMTLGLYVRKLGLADLGSVISTLHYVQQPGVDGSRALYVFWDPDCAFCHRDFLSIADNIARIHAANPELSIRWVPVGVLRAGSRPKAALALASYAAMTRDEAQYDDTRESGGLPAATAIDPGLAAAASANRLAYAALTGTGGTPSYLWTGGGGATLLPGSPDDMPSFLAGLR